MLKQKIPIEKSVLVSPSTTFNLIKKKTTSKISAADLIKIKIIFTPGPQKLEDWIKEALKEIPQSELKKLFQKHDYITDKGKTYLSSIYCNLYQPLDSKEGKFSTQPAPSGLHSFECEHVPITLKPKKKYAQQPDPVSTDYSTSDIDKNLEDWPDCPGPETEENVFSEEEMVEEVEELEASLLPKGKNHPLCFNKKHFPRICATTDQLFVLDGPYVLLDIQRFLEDILFKTEVRGGIHKVIIFADGLRRATARFDERTLMDYITKSGLAGIEPRDSFHLELKASDKAYHETENPWSISMTGSFDEMLKIDPAELKIDPAKIDTKKPLYTQISGDSAIKLMSFLKDPGIPYQFSTKSEKIFKEGEPIENQIKTFDIRSLAVDKTEQLEVFFLRNEAKEDYVELYKDTLLYFYEASRTENILIQGNKPEYILLLFEFLRNYDAIFNAISLVRAKAKIEEIIKHLQTKFLPLVPDEQVIHKAIVDAEKLQDYKLTIRQAPVSTTPATHL
jgi:hypothetical protein